MYASTASFFGDDILKVSTVQENPSTESSKALLSTIHDQSEFRDKSKQKKIAATFGHFLFQRR